MSKSKMITLEHRAFGSYDWNERDEARIERNVVARNGETWEALRFCRYRNGRHTRVHLVIREGEFVDLFRDAVRNGVFHQESLDRLRQVLEERRDPVLDVIGIAKDGKLAEGVDEQLYRDGPR